MKAESVVFHENTPKGIARNQLVVYGGVVYGSWIRIYRISKAI